LGILNPYNGNISKPLTQLLKNNCFKWGEEAENSFQRLKKAMSKTPVLIMPNFQQPFTLETDASENDIGAVLM
jgi:RNase H-like domain found in reverse transcriptase